MHICFAAIDFHMRADGGGIASYVDTLGEALVSRNHEVSVIAKGEAYDTEYHNGIRVVRVPLGNLHWYLYKLRAPSVAVLPLRELEWSVGLRRAVATLAAKHPVDVVESCETGLHLLSGSAGPKAPLVVRLHGEPYVFQKYSGKRIRFGARVNRWLELRSLSRAAAVTSPSRFQASELAGELSWPFERISVIPNPVSPILLRQAMHSTQQPQETAAPLVLFTGRIEELKGIEPLLKAAQLVSSRHDRVRFAVVGRRHTSIDDLALNRMLPPEPARARIDIVGHVPWSQVAEWYRRASVYVMPSYFETFGISVVEAMVFGLPVVATTAGGLPEVVEDGVTGILVPPGNAEALADAITRLIMDPDLRRRMGQAGRERALRAYHVDGIVEQTLNLYRSAVANDKPRGADAA